MPRINVEDEFFEDYRLKLLRENLGSDLLALGSVLRLWKLAQNFWKQGGRPIPKEAFKAFELPDALIEVGFARREGDGVYACGSKDRFQWLADARVSGSSGGNKSAAARANKINSLTEGSSKGFQPSSSSSSSSSKKEEKSTSCEDVKPKSARALPRIAQIWNENCGSLAKVKECGSSRMKLVGARWRERPEDGYWTDVVKKIAASDFCNGRVGTRIWFATFDFLIKPESANKVLEGQYDNRRGGRGTDEPNPFLTAMKAKGELDE